MSGSISDNVFRASGVIAAAAAGRTGTVDWDTSIHTGTVTAETAKGYFVNTTAGGITVNLPAAAVGSIVAVSDYASTAATNNITISPNGSDNINGINATFVIDTAGLAVTLVYADATRGWKSVTGSDADATGVVPAFIAATGGNCTCTCGDYKIHKFTGPGALCVSAIGNDAGNSTKLDFLVVAGGGSGGASNGGGGGGGAGGYRESKQPGAPWTASPIVATPSSGTNGITAAVQPYPIVIGGGGAAAGPGYDAGNVGSLSSFSTISSAGGGGGGGGCGIMCTCVATDGGSGGGGGKGNTGPALGRSGNTPPTTPSQGFDGGNGGKPEVNFGGGGGGATVIGENGSPPGAPQTGGDGGDGGTTCISGGPVAYAGGGGGNAEGKPSCDQGQGGAGGGTAGGCAGACAAANNTGGGGGGIDIAGATGAGGSGIVIIRYKFQ